MVVVALQVLPTDRPPGVEVHGTVNANERASTVADS
jgi:hypothetical protein